MQLNEGCGEFTDLARLMLRANGDMGEAESIAGRSKNLSERVRNLIQRAAVSGGSLGNDFAPLGIVGAAFLSSLKNVGVFDAMLGSMVNTPLNTKVGVVTSAINGSVTPEGSARPISRIALEGLGLTMRSASAIVVITSELAAAMGREADGLVSRELRSAVALSTDQEFLSGIIEGVTPIPSSGSTPAAITADLDSALDQMGLGSRSKVYMLTTPATVRHLATKVNASGDALAFLGMTINGGSLAGIVVLASDVIQPTGSPAAPSAVLVDASQIAASGGSVEIDVARHASLTMDDNPSMAVGGIGSPDTPIASEMINLFQSNARALRVQRRFGFQKLRASAAQVISAVGW